MKFYFFKKKTKEDLEKDNRDTYQKKNNISSIRSAVKSVMPNAYDFIDKKMMSEDDKDRTVELVGSKGTKLEAQGSSVLELNFAGSGFNEFRANHRHLTGKSVYQEDVHNKATRIKFTKPIKVSWYNRWLGKLPFIKSVSEIERLNALSAEAGKKLDEYYGRRVINPKTGKESKIRCKFLSDNKVRFNIPGPGMTNSGDYAIMKTREIGLDIAKAFLTRQIEDIKSGEKKEAPINLIIRGHSRGAVAAGESQQMIASWLRDTYPEYEKLVKFDLIQMDPVPGFNSHSNHHKIDFDEHLVDDKLGLQNRANTKAENLNSTVYFALTTSEDISHKLLFTPQDVKGAKRIILSPDGHSVGLNYVDESQMEFNGKLAKQGLCYSENGKVYRGTGVNDLPEGVFILDENNTLVKVNDSKQLDTILNTVLKDATKQKDRIECIKRSAGAWFERHDPLEIEKKEKLTTFVKEAQKQLVPVDENSRPIFTFSKDKKQMEAIAKFTYLQTVVDNSKVNNSKAITEAISNNTFNKEVKRIMNDSKFVSMFKTNVGKKMDARFLAEAYQRMSMHRMDKSRIQLDKAAEPEKVQPQAPVM